ncbi:hypothetical protein LCGC14_0338570 [marine sediment metagenome]|uniref:Uncharacterized protein n=1 Tax=marine sediment metagenome TaxID=412755 RepID=A0A0F9WM27_9ZZZZ
MPGVRLYQQWWIYWCRHYGYGADQLPRVGRRYNIGHNELGSALAVPGV